MERSHSPAYCAAFVRYIAKLDRIRAIAKQYDTENVLKNKSMYYVYVIQSKTTNNIYIGSTKDLRARLERHNGGYVTSTKSGIPWKLLYYEAYEQKTQARRSEIFYKKAQGRRQLKKKLDL